MKRVSIVTTVLNEAENCRVLLESLPSQTRSPDEVIVVDGGSTDGTLDVIRELSARDPRIKLVEAPGANIGCGRNTGVEHATGEIIASTDTGCRLDPRWLEEIVAPFEDDRRADFVAGFYKIAPESLLERVIGTTTMRGVLDPVDPEKFNPSARSMAFTKELWERAGRIPDFLDIDDTLFDHKIRLMNVRWVFAGDAIVYWRPRRTFRSLRRQFHFYGCGGGHTQIFSQSSLYNIRNLTLLMLSIVLALVNPWALAVTGFLFLYFYVHAYHRKCVRVMRAVGDWRAYFLALAVHWTIVVGDATGYITGSVQRLADPARYRDGMDAYLRTGQDHASLQSG
jgi:glycosyltransferase involved in cell wall biosynthesis